MVCGTCYGANQLYVTGMVWYGMVVMHMNMVQLICCCIIYYGQKETSPKAEGASHLNNKLFHIIMNVPVPRGYQYQVPVWYQVLTNWYWYCMVPAGTGTIPPAAAAAAATVLIT